MPEFQRWGLGLVLLRGRWCPKALSIGVEEAEFSWIAESNVMPRVGLEKMSATLSEDIPHVRSGYQTPNWPATRTTGTPPQCPRFAEAGRD